MAFFDFLTGKIQCPSCGTKGARKSGDGNGFRCPNPSCQWFDPALAQPAVVRKIAMKSPTRGDFLPARTIAICYRNFQSQEKTFTADAESGVRKNNRISVRVAPTGTRIALSRDRIQNLREVEDAFPQRVTPGQAWPTPRERQVLGYHKKHKTSSPLYEKIHAKYPNW